MTKGANITVTEAAARLGVSPQFVRIGLQQGVLPIGNAVKMSTKWCYVIPEQALEHYIEYGCNAYPAAVQTAAADIEASFTGKPFTV